MNEIKVGFPFALHLCLTCLHFWCAAMGSRFQDAADDEEETVATEVFSSSLGGNGLGANECSLDLLLPSSDINLTLLEGPRVWRVWF